jgi:SAM-dependent methyltransferase
MIFETSFDFVVGRFVLHHQTDPTELLRGIAKHVHPGGMILFHEPAWSFVRSEPAVPIYDRCCRWIVEVFDRAGASITNTGARMHRAFLAAGIGPSNMRMRTIIGDAASASEWLRAVADIATVMLPAMEERGIATSADVGSDTLAERLIREVASAGAVVIGRTEFGIWSRL